MITPLPGVAPLVPGSCALAFAWAVRAYSSAFNVASKASRKCA